MITSNQITFNIVSFPYGLSVKASRVQGVKVLLSAVNVDSVKDWCKGVGVNGLGLLRGVRGLRCGACVVKFQALTRVLYIIREKMSAYLVAVCSSLAVLCQLAYTSPAIVAVPCFASGILHGGRLSSASPIPYTPRPTDPHPHNFGADCYIHPTLTQTTFSSFKKHCTNVQLTNKDRT